MQYRVEPFTMYRVIREDNVRMPREYEGPLAAQQYADELSKLDDDLKKED